MASINFADLEAGDDLPPRELKLDSAFIAAHANAIDMTAPRFTDDEGARREGLPGQITPGAMSMGLFATTLMAWAPEARLTRLGCTFRSLAHAGIVARICGMVVEVDMPRRSVECESWMEDKASGDRLVFGTATLQFPDPPLV